MCPERWGTKYHVTRAADVLVLLVLGENMGSNIYNKFSAHIKLSYTPMPEDLPKAQYVSFLFKTLKICLLTGYVIPTISLKAISVPCIPSSHDEKPFPINGDHQKPHLPQSSCTIVSAFITHLIISKCSLLSIPLPPHFIHICQVSLTRL